jgi:hypothetical protein
MLKLGRYGGVPAVLGKKKKKRRRRDGEGGGSSVGTPVPG